MYPYYFNDENEAYALSADDGVVHVRLEEKDGQQARLRLSATETRLMAGRLQLMATEADGKANNPLVRRVVCAALRNCRGQIICGARHYDAVMRAQIHASKGRRYWKTFVKVLGLIVWRCPKVQQGFVDQWDVFMDRKEALEVALAAGQRIRRCGGDETELFSENLY